jgi:hypothetical protein
LERRSTQVAIARALNISVSQLVGSPADRVDPLLDRTVAHVPRIRQAVVELAAGERRAPRRDPDELAAAAQRVTHLRMTADHAALAPLLPALLVDIAGHGTGLAPQLAAVVDAGVYTLKAFGHGDLAHSLSSMAIPLVDRFEDPAWTGQARYTWVQAFPPESATLGVKVAEQAASVLQGRVGTDALQMQGHLHLMSAMAAAVSLKMDDARAHLAEAEQLASILGEPRRIGPVAAGFNGNWFGPTNVAFWRVAVAAELNDLGEALAVHRQVDITSIPVPSRLVYYWTDLARALVNGGEDRQALHALAKAEGSAPQHFRFNPIVRDLVKIIRARTKRRAVAGELTSLAHTLGLDPL